MKQQDIEKILRPILEELIDNHKLNPLEARNCIDRKLWHVTDDYMHEHYTVVSFDSPMGSDSEWFLRDEYDLMAEWDGVLGTRGTTVLYLPKEMKIDTEEGVTGIFNALAKISNNEELEDLFDKDSKITIELN